MRKKTVIYDVKTEEEVFRTFLVHESGRIGVRHFQRERGNPQRETGYFLDSDRGVPCVTSYNPNLHAKATVVQHLPVGVSLPYQYRVLADIASQDIPAQGSRDLVREKIVDLLQAGPVA